MKNSPRKNQKDLVSVIIPTYKRPNNIYRVVNNVLMQDYTNIEILVIDDNGRDSEFQKKTYNSLLCLLEKYVNIKYVILENNSGACTARNIGIDKARGEYVAFLDDDDYWHPNFISLMIGTLFKSNTQIGYSNFYRINEKGIFYNNKERYFQGNIRNELVKGWCPATTSLFCIKRNVLLNCGGFDSSLKNLEEYDLWLRLSEAYDFTYCEKRLVLKSEYNHDQLTNNYLSRIDAWNRIKDLWKFRKMKDEDRKIFFNMIQKNIISDTYHHCLRNNSNKAISQKYNFGFKRNLLIFISNIFGFKVIKNIKNFISSSFGSIQYLSKSDQTKIENKFNLHQL